MFTVFDTDHVYAPLKISFYADFFSCFQAVGTYIFANIDRKNLFVFCSVLQGGAPRRPAPQRPSGCGSPGWRRTRRTWWRPGTSWHVTSQVSSSTSGFSQLKSFFQSFGSAFDTVPFRIRTQHFRLNTDPDPGFWWPKIERKKLQWENFFFFWMKNYNLPIPNLHKGCPSYKRSLQFSKENIQHFETWNFWFFFYFVGHFCLLLRIHWPDRIRI